MIINKRCIAVKKIPYSKDYDHFYIRSLYSLYEPVLGG